MKPKKDLKNWHFAVISKEDRDLSKENEIDKLVDRKLYQAVQPRERSVQKHRLKPLRQMPEDSVFLQKPLKLENPFVKDQQNSTF
jgi:hypothetical protein